MIEPGEEYLGDGLYVSFDGWQFCLRAPREFGDHTVYLEPPVMHRFEQYVAAVRAANDARLRESAKE